MKDKHYRLGCDIGGTFTDFVLLNDQTGEIKTGKCLTTPGDPSDAVEEGIRELEKTAPDFVDQLDELIHGTTLVINSIIERKGARTGLITTKGFRDILEIGPMTYSPNSPCRWFLVGIASKWTSGSAATGASSKPWTRKTHGRQFAPSSKWAWSPLPFV
jgi:hypothetical protein